MSQRPLLPIWYEVDGKKIKSRVNRVLNTEIYEVDSWEYLYVITDIQIHEVPSDKIKKNKLFGIKVWLSEYVCFFYPEIEIWNLESIKKKLVSRVGFEAIAWMHDLKNLFLKEIVEPLKNPEKYKKYKLAIPNWVLFFWPPGCWKTFISRKLAEEIWYNFYEIKHSDIASPFIHGATWKIWEVFATAKENKPSIVFFDELSWLVPKRENLDWNSQYKEEEVNEFLIQLNDASKNQILVIWATNFPDRIDSAIMRAGRLDKRIYIWLPDFEARKELFEMYLKDRPLQDIDFEELARLTEWETYEGWTNKIWFQIEEEHRQTFSEKYVSSDISVMCDEFARKALAENSDITMDICKKVIKNFTPSVSQEDIEYYKSFMEWYQRV